MQGTAYRYTDQHFCQCSTGQVVKFRRNLNECHLSDDLFKNTDTNEVGLNGWAFDRRLNWNVRQSYKDGDNSADHNNSTLDMTWYGGYGQLSGNYNYSPHQRQMGAAVAGGMIVHRHGLTLGQTLSDTVALVEAPGASGIPVGGFPGVRTDFRGYTTSSNMSPYQENTISLDPTKFPQMQILRRRMSRWYPLRGSC